MLNEVTLRSQSYVRLRRRYCCKEKPFAHGAVSRAGFAARWSSRNRAGSCASKRIFSLNFPKIPLFFQRTKFRRQPQKSRDTLFDKLGISAEMSKYFLEDKIRSLIALLCWLSCWISMVPARQPHQKPVSLFARETRRQTSTRKCTEFNRCYT